VQLPQRNINNLPRLQLGDWESSFSVSVYQRRLNISAKSPHIFRDLDDVGGSGKPGRSDPKALPTLQN